ncbi:rRNA methyltransferase [Neisseria arctica]|uniref:rRNA methyltransferase n=1 Tax=Neisseria arctica TaxID=1470200 RepID=A0A0J1C582_9NEIS|nr:class I SAM-dependent methyltransferase [Neisseria arctica]KLT73458.1 rRNA methyltransferase [Neisseria arctica]UOO86117.1 methyltransferase domain-containing protein [Neisseria arctica]
MKHLDNILPFAHKLLRAAIGEGGRALDGTAGNGHDTLVLAEAVGETGRVWAFDVQAQALENTRNRLSAAGVSARVVLVLDSHEHVARHIHEPLDAAVFNFGWLPGGDKSLTTESQTSISALSATLGLLKEGGLLVAALYPGHEAGQYEAEAVEVWAAQLPQRQYAVLRYGFTNRQNRPPYLLAVEKFTN